MSPETRVRASPLIVGVAATILIAAFAARALSSVDWDASLFVAFGEDASPTREYAEERLGDIYLRAAQGHDGKFFFVQANDPWVTNPEENAAALDRPLYRSQRMLYPVLAGGAGLFGPNAIVWAMLIVNILAMGAGSYAVGRLAMDMGGSSWWGLAFVLNLGFISEVNIGGAGVVSAALAFTALVPLRRGKVWSAAVLLAFAALAREAMLIAAAGSTWWLWRQGRRSESVRIFSLPLAAILAWAMYLRMRMGLDTGISEVQEIGLPFVGFFEAFSNWIGDPLDLVVGVAMMALFFLYTRRVLISGSLVGWTFLGFVALGLVFTEQVWHSYFDITRAVAPLMTAFILMVFLKEKSPRLRTLVRRA